MKREAGDHSPTPPAWRILAIDPWLKPFASDINLRMNSYCATRASLLGGKTLSDFANGHLYFGIHRTPDGWVYREWAPAADRLFFMGDFNGWNRRSHPMRKLPGGVFELSLPGGDALRHGGLVKVIVCAGGMELERIPLYIRRVRQDKATGAFAGQVWQPEKAYEWRHASPSPEGAPLIYEAHVGMAQEVEAVGTYVQFRDVVLPHIKAQGYNTLQLMAVMEHPYYASFGYQVSNYFAASQWFGTPEDLKSLIDAAHGLGLRVLLDLVHSHAALNTEEGINRFDGSDGQFFHAGVRGTHPAWGSRLFDYGKHEVLHFLLSNIKFWLEEYRFDGFRFDGVTSMIYHDHGLGRAFSEYAKYFSMNTDIQALTYLQLANELAHQVRPDALTVAEDMSGMPGMSLPIVDGGIGFDYRLAMGVPDLWIKTLREADDRWDMRKIWHELTTRRPSERNIGYAESHDQALVGDKTIIFQLADQAMYTDMDNATHSLTIDRAMALHKLIRLLTLTLSGEGYLNFMGNEFGHPEWIDFPREGNGWSFKYARRQWSLLHNGLLKYGLLAQFDAAMLALVKAHQVLGAQDLQNLWIDQENLILAYRKGGLVFLFNFHPTRSQEGFVLPVHEGGGYRALLSSDEERFGGQGRVAVGAVYEAGATQGRGLAVKVYIPCRCALVMGRVG